jgi:hypothetical protein
MNQHIERPAISQRETSHTLPPELMTEAGRRLGWVGLVYVGTALVAHFSRRALLAWTESVDLHLDTGDVVGVGRVLMGLAVFAVSRYGRLSPKRLLDLGLAFQVAARSALPLRSSGTDCRARVAEPSRCLRRNACGSWRFPSPSQTRRRRY